MQSEKLKSSYGCALSVFREKYSEQSPSQWTFKQVVLYIASNIHKEALLLTWRGRKEWLFPLNVNYLSHIWKRILSVCTSIRNIFECIQYYFHTIQFCVWKNTNIYFYLEISCLFISIASSPFRIHWTCLTCENDLAQSNTVCCANKHLHEILYLVTSFHYSSPLGFVLVLIWSSLNIKLCKITANSMT